MAASLAIDVRDLCVDYGDAPVLRNLSLQVPAGQFMLLSGPSGCGKSTLARVLAGLIPHAIAARLSGQVFVDGINVQEASLPDLAHHAGIVLQNPSSQLFHLTVAEEVAFGPRNLGLDGETVRCRVDWALAATGLQSFGARRPADLSGGEQQRVAIAAVLAMQPRVLILDEPTASLDTEGTQMVLATLRRLNERLGITVVLVEHRLAPAIPFAERLLVIDQGRIVADGPAAELVQDHTLRERFGLRRSAAAHNPSIWRQLLTADGAQASQSPISNPQSPLIHLTNVHAGYRGKTVLQQITLSIYPGEFVAVVGKNGSGKSTLARVIAGLLRPTSGAIHFQRPGDRTATRRSSGRVHPGRDVALLFQNPLDQLFTDTVDEEIAFGPSNFGRFDGQFHDTILHQADLHGLRERCPTRLSVGQQQRCVLAACLALQPHLLILDEPTLGQDWGHLQQLMDFVLEMNKRGTAILLISHDYKLVYRYARRVLLLENGRISLDGAPMPQQAVPDVARMPAEMPPAAPLPKEGVI